jgi:quinohemoprotein ethanol dehydrogenase
MSRRIGHLVAGIALASTAHALWAAQTPGAAQTPVAGEVTDKRIVAESAQGENWFVKGGNFDGQHYSPLARINEANIDQLGLAWATDLPVADGISATPIVVDGVIYLSGAFSLVFAVDAATGRLLWSYDPKVREAFSDYPMLSWPARVNRGVAVWDGRVYLSTADCRLIALDARDGSPQWSKQTCDPEFGYYITDSPYAGGGRIFLGNAGSESAMKGRGYVSAYDPGSGELLWRFYIVPSADPAENDTAALKMAAKTWSGDTLAEYGGGGHNWNGMTYDPASNLLFFGTSGAYPYQHAKRSPAQGDNLFLSSVVAVDADTGAYRWHYQTVDRDSWDYNATMNIVLAGLTIRGEDREVLMIAPKNGFHYALDRHTGELLTVGRFARTSWASDIDVETGKPVYEPAGEFWNLEDGESAYLWPNMWGAHGWNPMAYHPAHALTYIPVIDAPARVDNQGDGEAIVMLTEVDGRPHSPGKLVAFDPVSASIRWTVDRPLPFNGGLMATGGNLLFQGTATGHFEAYSADRGERLWSVQTGSAINAAPASFLLGGSQYVVIPVGTGGGLQFQYPQMHAASDSRGPARLLAFSLGGGGALPIAEAAPRPLPPQPKLDASGETVALGQALYGDHCKICHGSGAVARPGGSVPDLRYASAATHEAWDATVIGGGRRAGGMPPLEITPEESEAIRSYVLSRSEELRAAR